MTKLVNYSIVQTRMYVIVLFSIIISGLVPLAAGASPLSPCELSLLDQALPGHTVDASYDVRTLDGQGIYKTERTYVLKRMLDNIEIGLLAYKIIPEGPGTLRIGWADIDSDYRRRGIYKFLVGEALRRNPGLKRITGTLDDDNARIYWRALDVIRSTRRELSGVAMFEEAIKETPAYKVRQAFGFERIEWVSVDMSVSFGVIKD